VIVPLVLMWIFDKAQIGQLTLGLGAGALIAAIALGVVLTFKGSGVVNFHNGVVAIYTAYVFHGLRGVFDNGKAELYLPPLPNPLAIVEGIWNSFVADKRHFIDLPNWPTKIALGDGRLPIVVAFVVALSFAALLGVIFHVLIFRPLRHAPPLAKVVASVGLFLLLINIITLRFTGTFKPVAEPNLGKKALKPFGGDIVIQREQLVAAGLVLLVTVVLTVMFKRTRFGLATRAAAENE
jgi:branched-chain amino acid transport system permease protein